MHPRDAYAELLRRSRERALLASCLELLGWDELTQMPPGGVAFRGRQMAYLAGRLHASAVDPLIAELLDVVERSELSGGGHEPIGVNLRRWRWSYDRLSRVPRPLVEELADVTTAAQQVWAESRERGTFDDFQPWLERVVALKRSEAECLAQQGDPYDALLDEYEPGATSVQLSGLFAELREQLTPILAAAADENVASEARLFHGRAFPLDRQQKLSRVLAETLGFDLDCGRIDTTAHPFFTAIGPGDCRITTRYTEEDFREGFFAVLHEVGHALYEQGIDPELHGTPAGEAPSLGLHESQSRLWENGVGRSRSFWRYFYPQVQRYFPEAIGGVAREEFVRSLHRIRPGPVRVGADRATYDLHILVRFELERALISGDLRPADLPGAWRERYAAIVGVVPLNNGEGCLQDGHWSAGQFGYFPTYTLGNIYAAQLLEAAHRALPDLEAGIAAGDFGELREWLRREVYARGQRCSTRELIEQATGRPADVGPLVRSFRIAEVDEAGL